jgi:putative Mg2+ transporter-C (MgtC) family protein
VDVTRSDIGEPMLRPRIRQPLRPARNTVGVAHSDLALLARIVLGFALAYMFGFERELRGSVAGDRTFAMVGAAVAAITSVAAKSSPQAIAGAVTGIGFIGGGVVFRGQMGAVKGVTTAATIFAAAAIGVVVGFGHLLLAVIVTALLLLTLEIQHIPFLRWLDARSYAERFSNDREMSTEPKPELIVPTEDEGGRERT